jgi:hypothetical protein
MLLGFTALGIAGVGIGIHDFRSHDPEVSPSVGVIGGAMAIASGVSYGLSRIKEHKRQKSFVNSVRIIKEAGELEIKPNGILELLYKKLVLNSKDQSLKTHVTPRLFSNIILEANQRSTFCPLYNTPMTSQQIEEWIKIYLRDKAPQL